MLAAAVLLHDCVSLPKNSPHRSQASRLAAEKARSYLEDLGWAPARVQTVAGRDSYPQLLGRSEPDVH